MQDDLRRLESLANELQEEERLLYERLSLEALVWKEDHPELEFRNCLTSSKVFLPTSDAKLEL
jgi:hypothetical protein